jgi:aspartate carbamoyltransferase regulatory subunit
MGVGGLDHSQELAAAREQVATMGSRMRDLEHEISRLSLLNQALWELIRERLNVTDADLEQKAREVDLRDGVEDGCITNTAVQCPRCGRISNSKHYKCLYCGQEFEKPAMT